MGGDPRGTYAHIPAVWASRIDLRSLEEVTLYITAFAIQAPESEFQFIASKQNRKLRMIADAYSLSITDWT